MITRLARILAYCSGIALLCMAFLGAADIILTQFFGRPISGTVEITSSLMVVSIFFGVTLAEARNHHVRVEVLVAHFPRRTRRMFDVASRLSMAVFFALVAWFGWGSFIRSVMVNEYAQGLIEVPYWPSRLALAIGASLMVVQALLGALRDARSDQAKTDSGTPWRL